MTNTKSPYQMNWGQRGSDILLEFVVLSSQIDISKIDISLTDRSCLIMFSADINFGWNFYEEVSSKLAKRVERENKLILSVPKQNPSIKWPTFKKQQLLLPRKLPEPDTAESQPPVKMLKSPPYPLEELKMRAKDPSQAEPTVNKVIENYEEEYMKEKIAALRSCNPHDLIEISNANYEVQDLNNEDVVLITLYIADIDPWGVFIEFQDLSISVKFKTGDQSVLQKYSASTDSVFHWYFQLRSAIIPSKCSFQVSFKSLAIKIKKKKAEKWQIVSSNLPGGARLAQPPAKEIVAKEASRPDRKEDLINENLTPAPSLMTPFPVGFTGLDNLGNTCFMNTVIQVLANSPEVKDLFLSGRYKRDINVTNPLGAGGKLVTVFQSVLTKLWEGKLTSYPPIKLKDIVAPRDSPFYGCLQHDAQEFMAHLLDGLHEDINRIRVKPYTDCSELEEAADHIVSAKAWELYLARNNSYIIDFFHGQLKSKLICPHCNKTSITFDPFAFLPVPLPKPMRTLNLFYFGRDHHEMPTKFSIRIKKDETTVANFLKEVSKITGDSPDQLRLFHSKNSRIQKIYVNTNSIGYIGKDDMLSVFHNSVSIQIPDTQPHCVAVVQRHTSTEVLRMCEFCHKLASSVVQIRRCTNCRKVGYCDRECQRRDWMQHKRCCTPLDVLGTPFNVSFPSPHIKYDTLCRKLWMRARHSVRVDGPLIENFLFKTGNDNNMSGDDKMKPPFLVTPIKLDMHLTPLQPTFECTSEEEVDLSNLGVLAMDWQNQSQDELKVEGKPLACRESPNTKTSDDITLNDCIKLFMEPEVLAATEAWYCPKCKEHRQATKQLSLWSLPDTLIIQLKRFSFKNAIWRDKLDTFVDIPTKSLDMHKYCLHQATNRPAIYDLFGVINHHGGILGGHYTNCVRLPNIHDSSKDELGWRLCDDNKVTNISEDKVVTRAAYVMVYRRRHMNKTNPNQPHNQPPPHPPAASVVRKPTSPQASSSSGLGEPISSNDMSYMETSSPERKATVSFAPSLTTSLQGKINYTKDTMLAEKDVFGMEEEMISEEVTSASDESVDASVNDSGYTDMYAID